MEKTQRKKILYIITQSEFGGAQRYLFELITHLLARRSLGEGRDPEKYDITVAAGPASSADEPGGDFLDRLKAQNCRIWRLKHLGRLIIPHKDILAYFELKKLINTIKPDILQLHSTKAGVLGSLAAKNYNSHIRKIGIHSQNLHVIYRIGGWAFLEDIPWWKKWLYIKAEKWTGKYKDIIINNCEAHRQLAIKLGIAPAEKIKTIYNGIDLNKLTFLNRQEARQKLTSSSQAVKQSSIVIGTIANFYKNKGLKYLIKAVSQLSIIPASTKGRWASGRNYQLLIIGDGAERKNIENLIQELNLENQVILTGKIKNAHQYLKAFDIFVLPSIKEGQPWSLMEAMAAELPIVATNVAAIPEMIEDGKSGLIIESKNPQAIAEKIGYLANNHKIAESLGKNARQVIEKKFTTQRMITGTIKTYEDKPKNT
ncbi:glycosyltransferase family 4 protein [Patescibacteria group bacterium]|nr:glycosyltransferase family 4 protein [Patescibacteria group bacterium]MBU4512512.1 glycosyltransferase family 4 protein [Patescibacteria group bacterium]MCG2693509.1 glycosyltransferase family 4 protein [Candidatus Parcubacteria bacterium]